MKLITIATLSLATTAWAQPRAGELLKSCEASSRDSDVPRSFCNGYLLGWLEGFWRGQVSAPGKSPALTEGEDLTLEQIRQVFVGYMAAHPEKEKDNVGSAMLHALGKAGLLHAPPERAKN